MFEQKIVLEDLLGGILRTSKTKLVNMIFKLPATCQNLRQLHHNLEIYNARLSFLTLFDISSMTIREKETSNNYNPRNRKIPTPCLSVDVGSLAPKEFLYPRKRYPSKNSTVLDLQTPLVYMPHLLTPILQIYKHPTIQSIVQPQSDHNRYAAPPKMVNPTPAHQTRSRSMRLISEGCSIPRLICLAFLLRGRR